MTKGIKNHQLFMLLRDEKNSKQNDGPKHFTLEAWFNF